MTDIPRYALILLLAVLIPAVLAPDAHAKPKQPKSVLLCLPPGGNPAPCGITTSNTALLITLSASASPTIFFNEVTQNRKSRLVQLSLAGGSQVKPGVYRVALPPSLCAGRRGIVRYEVQDLVPGFNLRDTIDLISVAC